MKKKILISFIAIASTIIAGRLLMPQATNNIVSAQEIQQQQSPQKDIPTYAKWGRLAMEKVKEKYPSHDIIDYLHVGKIEGDKTSQEKFKLWLRGKDNKEFGVYVTITYDNKTEKVIKIDYKETNV